MSKQDRIEKTIREFCCWLKEHGRDRLECFAKKENGFEAWLKLEMAYWLEKESEEEWEVKLESSFPLSDCGDKKSKRVDIAFGDEEGPHLVELKTIFVDWTPNKMAQSAGWDLWYLQRAKGAIASRGSLVFIVGKNEVSEDLKNQVLNAVESAAESAIAVSNNFAISATIIALYIRTADDDKSVRDSEEEAITGESPSGVKREIAISRFGENKEDLRLGIRSPGGSGWEIILKGDGKKRFLKKLLAGCP